MLIVTDSLKNTFEEGVRFPGVVTGGKQLRSSGAANALHC